MAGLFGLIRRMDTKKMRATAAKVVQESGKSKLGVLADMVWCGLRYEAGYSDYALFHMWEMNRKQRASVLTRGKNNRYVRALNKHEDMHYFAEKTEFLKAFASYVGRRWLDLRGGGRGRAPGDAHYIGRGAGQAPGRHPRRRSGEDIR